MARKALACAVAVLVAVGMAAPTASAVDGTIAQEGAKLRSDDLGMMIRRHDLSIDYYTGPTLFRSAQAIAPDERYIVLGPQTEDGTSVHYAYGDIKDVTIYYKHLPIGKVTRWKATLDEPPLGMSAVHGYDSSGILTIDGHDWTFDFRTASKVTGNAVEFTLPYADCEDRFTFSPTGDTHDGRPVYAAYTNRRFEERFSPRKHGSLYAAETDTLIDLTWHTDSLGLSGAESGYATGTYTCLGGKDVELRLYAGFEPRRFKDVGFEQAHVDAIDWMGAAGISTGYADGTFGYGRTVLRQDMAAFLHRFAARYGIADATSWKPTAADWARFTDVTTATPHAEDILWLAHAGITTGFADGTFRGTATLNRQDTAAFLHRVAMLWGLGDASGTNLAFTDVTDATPHADDIRWMAAAGISTGYANGDGTYRFEGAKPVQRQDLAAFLYRLQDAAFMDVD